MNKSKKIKKLIISILIVALLIIYASCSTSSDNINNTVGLTRLNIETYLAGKDQPTHPSIISFDDEWNGYKYWMAYTPYPEANGEEENPCIAVSNDLYKWETPVGMVNPIADNEETGCAELKDSHILYRDDLNRIEVWYLGRVSKNIGGDDTSLTLFRKYSYDGITWSNYEIMDYVSYLSPTVFWDGEKYKMWSIGFDTYDTTGTFVYQESKNGTEWSTPQKCSVDEKYENIDIWHGAVFYDKATSKYMLVYLPNTSNTVIKFCSSDNGINYSNSKTVISVTENSPWEGLYRPAIIVEDNIYHLFYGVTTADNKWHISYSKGENINNLVGITDEDASKMVSLNSAVSDTKNITYKIKQIYYSIRTAIRFETSGFVVLLILLKLLFNKKKHDEPKVIMVLTSFILCFLYTFVLLKDTSLYGILGILCASIIEGICIYSISDVVGRMMINKYSS